MRTWAMRKIRKGGRIKFNGAWWYPKEDLDKYDGSLDGWTYLFHEYRYAEPRLVGMWGTKDYAECIDCGEGTENHSHFEPHIDTQNRIRWYFWETVRENDASF